MNYKFLDKHSHQEVTKLFKSAFTASEGKAEGEQIGKLVSQLCSSTDNTDIICIGAYENELLVGTIFFTRLRFEEPVLVYMLAPVAVSPEHQGKGVGQALIRHGLNELKKRSVAIAITYGDPAFYTRVGFRPLSEKRIKAPLRLSMPEGWLGQSLTEESIPMISDRPTCVKEFNDSAYW